MEVDRIRQARIGIHRHRGPFDAAVGTGQHAGALFGGQHPHVLLRHHRLRETNEAAVAAVVHVDVPGLAGMQYARHRFAVLVLDVDQNGWADGVEVPDVVSDVLEVTDVATGLEIERHQRVGIEVVAGPQRPVEVGRRITDQKIDAVCGEVYRRILPHAAAERLVGVTSLRKLRLLGRDVAVHVTSGGVLLGPDTHRILGRGVEGPQKLAGLGVVGAKEATHAVLAAVGTEQYLPLDGGRRHGLAVTEFRIGDLGLPHHFARLGVERDKLGIERRHVDLVVVDGDAAIVRAAAEGGDRPQPRLEVPQLFAGAGIERVDVAV